jgi:hypothetical protein
MSTTEAIHPGNQSRHQSLWIYAQNWASGFAITVANPEFTDSV